MQRYLAEEGLFQVSLEQLNLAQDNLSQVDVGVFSRPCKSVTKCSFVMREFFFSRMLFAAWSSNLQKM